MIKKENTMKRFHIKWSWKRIFGGLCIIGVVGTITLFGVNAYVKNAYKSLVLTPEEAGNLGDVDCILILGAGIWNNERPSHMLEDRLLEGINLYQDGVSNKLLMSGDHGRKNYDEVNVMKQFAVDRQVPSSDVFMDHAGFSTYESLYRARDIFEANKIVIVTQEYHMYRALHLGKKLGLEVYGVPSDPRSYVGQSKRELREILARNKDFFYALFQPKPTYLGEVIPVSGDGDVTND